MKLLILSIANLTRAQLLDGSGESTIELIEVSDKAPLASLELLAPIYQECLAPLR